MSKRMTRVLSLILTLVMFVSVSTPAFAWGGGDLGKGWDREIGEDEIRDFDEPVVEEEESLDYFHTLDEDSMVEVMVEAPMGALPTLAELRAEPVEIEDVREAVESVMEGETNILLAMDISFWMNGIEIEPEEPVRVKITAPALEDKDNLTLIHIPDADEPETIDLIDDEDLSFALGTNEIAFETDSFSTYVITWNGDESATVHWGTMNGSNFEEFDRTKVVTLDTTAATISLDVDFEGFVYLNATYKPAAGNETAIGPTLQKVDGKWQVGTRVLNDETGESETVWVELKNTDEIYVKYAEITPSTTPGQPEDPSKVPTPDTDKNVLENEDGTRTVVLDVTGTKVSEDNSYGANVLIILDNTNSMNDRLNGYGTPRRWPVAKAAIDTLVTTLTPGNEDDPDVQYALLDFHCEMGNSGRYNVNRLHSWNSSTGAHQDSGTNYWTKNATQFNTNYIQRDTYIWSSATNGTNWESPLYDAQTILAKRDSDKTYVIFITDGEPNCAGINSVYTYWDDDVVQPAVNRAKEITDLENVVLYGVFCGNDNGYKTLNGVIKGAGGEETVDGSSEEAMEEAFGKIAQRIISDLYANDVSVDDGVPSLSSVSSGVVEGGAGGYEYFRLYPLTAGEGGAYTYTVAKDDVRSITAAEFAAKKDSKGNAIEEKDGTYYIEIRWTEGYPGASYNQANGVTWDLSTVPVQPGVTYRLKFKVWPSQEAYDYIANLNNGLVVPMPSDAELKEMGIEKNDDGVYYLLTNTHLKTTYSFKGTTYEDSPEKLPTSEMILPTTTITVKKIWNNDLDPRSASDVSLTVTKDGEPYLYDEEGEDGAKKGIHMTGAKQTGDHEWTQTNDTPIYISMGQLTLDGEDNIEVISSGHDYTVVEPASFSYYWELTADNYHPMVINGTATVLVEVTEEQKAELPTEVTGAQNKHVENGGKHYYAFNDKLYVAQAGENVLSATNDRRSNLNLTKKVEAGEGIQIPEDALFTYSAKITYPEGINDDVWFSIMDKDGAFVVNDADHTYVEGAEQEAGASYYHMASGAEVTLKIQAGWNVRFTNMPNDTQYEFTETAQPDGFVFKSVEAKADNGGASGTVADTKVSGTIDKPNNVYTATFTNECVGFFYVYHSSDLTVERFPMAVNGVAYSAEKTFNLYELAKADTLYGGYYSEYAGRDKDFDVTAQDYSAEVKDANGTAYSYQAIKDGIVWSWADGYDLDAREMVPVSNAVYYLKEVPNGYLKPYTHFTYFKESKNIATLYTITDSDDLMYTSAGFLVKTDDLPAIMVESMTITAANNSASTLTLTADKVFKSKGVLKGWLGYADITEYKGAETTIVQYWVTKDGITTYGDTQRTLTFTGTTISDIKKVDAPYKP